MSREEKEEVDLMLNRFCTKQKQLKRNGKAKYYFNIEARFVFCLNFTVSLFLNILENRMV